MDNVRKIESKSNSELKGSKYLWLKNDENLTDRQRQWKQRIMLSSKHMKTSRAYAMKVELQEIYEECSDRGEAETRLKKLCSWMMHSRLDEMKVLCKTIRNHWNVILNYFEYRLTNAILEGVNSIIQNIKRRARGFSNFDYFKTMIYLVCGGLDIESAMKYKPVIVRLKNEPKEKFQLMLPTIFNKEP